jgi:hypothetical protein
MVVGKPRAELVLVITAPTSNDAVDSRTWRGPCAPADGHAGGRRTLAFLRNGPVR